MLVIFSALLYISWQSENSAITFSCFLQIDCAVTVRAGQDSCAKMSGAVQSAWTFSGCRWKKGPWILIDCEYLSMIIVADL